MLKHTFIFVLAMCIVITLAVSFIGRSPTKENSESKKSVTDQAFPE